MRFLMILVLRGFFFSSLIDGFNYKFFTIKFSEEGLSWSGSIVDSYLNFLKTFYLSFAFIFSFSLNKLYCSLNL